MNSSSITVFSNLKKQVQIAQQKNSNVLLFTFVGSGCTHYLKQLAQQDNKLTYINSINQKLGKFNLIDLPFTELIDYVKGVTTEQKYLIIASSGEEYHSSQIKYLASHAYFHFPLAVSSYTEISDMITRHGGHTLKTYVNQIMNMSGGIPKLAKHLIIHGKTIDLQDESFQLLVKKISDSLIGFSQAELQQLGLVDNDGKYISTILSKFQSQMIDIKINFNLSFTEKNILSLQKLNMIEAKIINKMIENNGKISKSEVSDIKWGENKYDEFSDQAINKQIRRLSQKLSKYTIKTIPKVGFILETV